MCDSENQEECGENEEEKDVISLGGCYSTSLEEEELETADDISEIEEPVAQSTLRDSDESLTKNTTGTFNRTSSESTIQFELDPKTKKKTKVTQIVRTAEEEEREKANKYRLFQVECDINEAVKLIEKLLEKNLLLISKKKRRDADLQRFESKIGDKTIKKNCVRHNWELFEVQEKHRELRSKYIVELSKERDIDKETKLLSKTVDHLSTLAEKSRNDSLDNLEHLQVRWEIQTQLYDQEFERLGEEKKVLQRDLRLLEENHHKVLTTEREKLKILKKEHLRMKNYYLRLLEGKKGSSID